MSNANNIMDLPQSLEAEESLLGGLLLTPKQITQVRAVIRPDDLFYQKSRLVYAAMLAVADDLGPQSIDLTTLTTRLRETGQLNDAGGPAYLTQLVNNTPSGTLVTTYAQLVRRAAGRRAFMVAADDIRRIALNQELTFSDVQAQATARLSAVNARYVPVQRDVTIQQAVHELTDLLENSIENGPPPGWTTGFTELDRDYLPPLTGGRLIVVGGRAKAGKSTVMTNLALNIVRQGAKVGFFSYELGTKEVTARFVGAAAGLPIRPLLYGQLTSAQFAKYIATLPQFTNMALRINTDARRPSSLEAKIVQWQAEMGGLDVVFVDQLTLMEPDEKRIGDTERLRSLSQALKRLAMDTNTCVILAHQINRAGAVVERPTANLLRNASEEDCDAALLLHNPDEHDPHKLEVYVDANRMGPTGMVELYIDRAEMRVANLRRGSLEAAA